MKTSPAKPADLAQSVLAVPPLARHPDLSLDRVANAKLIRHIEAGGIRTMMYGGNANFYHVGSYELAGILDFLAEAAGEQTWMIPSIGPDYGKMIDQVDIMRSRAFPTAMVLPQSPPISIDGIAAGLRRVADRFGRPLILYIKDEGRVTPDGVARLFEDGVLCGVKYAINRANPSEDTFLKDLVARIGTDRIVSGMGERPAIAHLKDFRLAAFTSGLVCIAPRTSNAMLAAIRRSDWAEAERIRQIFVAAEDLREKHGFIPVLHDAVTFSGIADMGRLLPLLSNLPEALHAPVRKLASELVALEAKLTQKAA